MTIPVRRGKGTPDDITSPSIGWNRVSSWVAFLVVPVFGFANAGVAFRGMSSAVVLDPITLGIALALFIGKQLDVLGAANVAIKLRWADLPVAASWTQLYGVSLRFGIGFTMSLLIGLLAFPDPVLRGGGQGRRAARLAVVDFVRRCGSERRQARAA